MEQKTIGGCSMERLTERFSNGQAAVYGCGSNCKYDYKYCNNHTEDCPTIIEIYEKLAHYEDLEEQGRLIELPCKVGDILYFHTERYEKEGRKKVCIEYVEEGVVDNIKIGMLGIPQVEVCTRNNYWTTFDTKEDFNKTVFLTKEEAEQALAEMQKG